MDVFSSISFLAHKELYDEEKPYRLKYEVPDTSVPSTNITAETQEQTLRDVRGNEKDFSIAKTGFSLLRLEATMAYDDYEDEEKITNIYLKQVADGVKELLGASRVQIFEHVV